MAKMTEREKLVDGIVQKMEEELEKHKAYLDEERGAFHRTTGARGVLLKLWTLGAIHPDYEASIGEWLKKGGYTTLQIDGITIVGGR